MRQRKTEDGLFVLGQQAVVRLNLLRMKMVFYSRGKEIPRFLFIQDINLRY